MPIKTDLSTYNNSWYKPAGFLKILVWYFVNRFFINTYLPFPNFFKIAILKIFGSEIGKGVVIKPKVNIKYPWFLKIENNVWIGEKVWIDNLTYVTLGSNVCLSQESMLLCGNHDYKSPSFDLILGEIFLAEGSWVGAKAVVCPSVTLHSHAVLAVGSVATKDLDAYSIYAGVPAIKVRERIISKDLAVK